MDGVYSADPRRVPTARRYDEIDTGEMLRLAALGAQVLHDRCVSLARRYAMPLEVRSSFSDAPGTTVRPLPTDTPRLTAATATGSTVHLVGSRLSALPELTERARSALERAGLAVKRGFADDHRLSVTVEGDAARALRVLHDTLILGIG